MIYLNLLMSNHRIPQLLMAFIIHLLIHMILKTQPVQRNRPSYVRTVQRGNLTNSSSNSYCGRNFSSHNRGRGRRPGYSVRDRNYSH